MKMFPVAVQRNSSYVTDAKQRTDTANKATTGIHVDQFCKPLLRNNIKAYICDEAKI